MLLDGKTAVVTGAAQGIGREIAIKFSEQGANVVVADLHPRGSDNKKPTHEIIGSVQIS